MILSDEWSGQKNITAFDEFPRDRCCTRLLIAAGTTGKIQPLDVYYFGPWKRTVHRIYNYAKLHKIDVDLGQRDNIIKMHSLIHNQFSSEKFLKMGKYAQFKAGLSTDDPGEFESAAQILFPRNSSKLTMCSSQNCSNAAFICCSICNSELCFSHFFFNTIIIWSDIENLLKI